VTGALVVSPPPHPDRNSTAMSVAKRFSIFAFQIKS
jgi:hypothetical protein